MKVLHVIPSVSEARGGPSAVMKTVAASQAEMGLEVHVATTDDDGLKRIKDRTNTVISDGRVTYWFFPRQTCFYTFSAPLTRWLRESAAAYDVIHIHALFSYPSVAAAFSASRAGIPYVVRPLGTLNRWGMSHRRPFFKRLSLRFVESRILSGAAAVQFTSQQEAVEAAALDVRHRGIVIPNPVEPPCPAVVLRGAFRHRHPSLTNKTTLLFLSRLDPIKGLDLLLPAFAILQRRFPDTALVIAGDGDPHYIASLHHQARQLRLEDSILWTGFLKGEEKQAALADSDLYVLPSYSENFGVAVVEAMGAGIPVVVSDQVGIHREISGAGAGLVTECSVERLAAALIQACESPEWRRSASESAIRLAARFSPVLIAKQLVDLYDQIRIHRCPAAA